MKIIKNISYFRIGIFLLTVFLCSCSVSRETYISEALEEMPEETTTQSITAEATLSEEEKAEKVGKLHRTLEFNDLSQDFEQVIDGNLKNMDYTDCSVAAIDGCGDKIYEWLSEENKAKFIECITQADISPKEYDELPKVAGGNAFGFKIVLNTGNIIFIRQLAATIVINEKGYPCDDESLRQMKDIYYEISNRFLEKAWEQ